VGQSQKIVPFSSAKGRSPVFTLLYNVSESSHCPISHGRSPLSSAGITSGLPRGVADTDSDIFGSAPDGMCTPRDWREWAKGKARLTAWIAKASIAPNLSLSTRMLLLESTRLRKRERERKGEREGEGERERKRERERERRRTRV